MATKGATFTISASKHGGQFVNEFFKKKTYNYFEVITLSPGYLKGWRIFTMTAVILVWTKNPFKNLCSKQSRIVNTVVTLIPSRLDRFTEICFSPN